MKTICITYFDLSYTLDNTIINDQQYISQVLNWIDHLPLAKMIMMMTTTVVITVSTSATAAIMT